MARLHPNGITDNNRFLRAGLLVLLLVLLGIAALVVQAQTTPPPFNAEELDYAPLTQWELAQSPEITAMQDTIRSVLAHCEIAFPGSHGDTVTGFVPGADYPMIFARDTSTLLQTATYFYPAEWLKNPIEEFLRRQYTDQTASDEDGVAAGTGAISAVIAPDGHIDKATAVSDEETHLIHAANVYYRAAGGERWLSEEILEQTIIDRLNRAMDWLYAHRLDSNTGLIKRAHTTDWGDVKIEPAANPTDIDPDHDQWTASLYDQALTYRALTELAEMNRATGNPERAADWLRRAGTLWERAHSKLWQPDKGFFRTHIHLTPLPHDFDEDSMISIANTVAIRCGLTDEEQALRIAAALEMARRAAGANKPGIVLYPPYPDGTFATERMRPGHYQNGALWDWWAGWQILAEFESGNAQLAQEHLEQIARDWATHPGQVFEWQTIPDNAGHGPDDYAGAAGTVGEAIIAGLFGVSIDQDRTELRPRLRDQEGFVRIYQPSTDHYVAYRYTPKRNALYLDYGSAVHDIVSVACLIPEGQEVSELLLDGRPIPHHVETLGRDTYVTVEAPAGTHRLTIALKD